VSINIKNDQAVDALRRLAAHYGLNYGAAITAAAEAVLAQPRPSDQARASATVRRIVADYRAHVDPTVSAALDDATLYDEAGLYR